MTHVAISVAMATYNGERYLREQLHSLLTQDQLPNDLVVCDDGSTDATLRILKEFAAEAPFPVRIEQNEHNLGYGDNFFKAARLCEGEWIAFCDQDDVWLPNKLADCVAAIQRHPDLTMILQNANLCDADLSPRGRLFPNRIKPGLYGPNRQHASWVWQGFVVTFNAALVHELDTVDRPLSYRQDKKPQPHDKWVCTVANALGGIAVLAKPAALYRRHDTALTGNYHIKPLSQRVSGSLTVGSEHYALVAQAAHSSAEYLCRMAKMTGRLEWRDHFHRSSTMFRRLSRIMIARSRLYHGSSRKNKLSAFLNILGSGGYFGPALVALGWKSALKDALIAIRNKEMK